MHWLPQWDKIFSSFLQFRQAFIVQCTLSQCDQDLDILGYCTAIFACEHVGVDPVRSLLIWSLLEATLDTTYSALWASLGLYGLGRSTGNCEFLGIQPEIYCKVHYRPDRENTVVAKCLNE